MKDYITKALRTEAPPQPIIEADRLNQNLRAIHALFGLQTEVGEMVDAYKRHIFYGKPLDPINVAEEVGDLFWYLAILCDELGVSFEACMGANIAKLTNRYPDRFTEDAATTRDLDTERTTLEETLEELSFTPPEPNRFKTWEDLGTVLDENDWHAVHKGYDELLLTVARKVGIFKEARDKRLSFKAIGSFRAIGGGIDRLLLTAGGDPE